MDLHVDPSGNNMSSIRSRASIISILSQLMNRFDTEPIESVENNPIPPILFIQSVLSQPDVSLSATVSSSTNQSQPSLPAQLVHSPPITESGGWSVERFLNQPMDDFICSICHDVCKEAMSLNCGHTFCQSCILLSEANFQNKCPDCRTLSMHLVPDFSKRMKINGCMVHCKHKENGCPFTDALSRIFVHEFTCYFKKLPCVDCTTLYCANEMDNHRKNECMYRIQSCEQCNQLVRHIEYENHSTVTCPTIERSCEYCSWKGKQELMNDHLELCPNLSIPCLYAKYGCTSVVKRDEMKEHLDKINHLDLVCETLDRREQHWSSVQYDGPFRIRSHLHTVVLCEDMKDALCDECKKKIVEEDQKWFAYYCTAGCTYCVCPTCFIPLRMHKSRTNPNESMLSFSFSTGRV